MGHVRGEVEKTEDGVIVIRRIHVTYTLKADPAKRKVVDRVFGFHARRCPVARTIGGSVEITTELDFVEQPGEAVTSP